jgi:hypothetical protein
MSPSDRKAMYVQGICMRRGKLNKEEGSQHLYERLIGKGHVAT